VAEPEKMAEPEETAGGTGTGAEEDRDGAVVAADAATTTAADAETATSEDAGPDAGEKAAGGMWGRLSGHPLLLPALLGVVTVILGGLAVWFGVQAHNLTSQPSARNTALTGNAATSQVKAQVSSAVDAIFSYSYTQPATTMDAARRLVTGNAVQQYEARLRPVEQEAPEDKLMLTTQVTTSGVELLQGDRARVLMFGTQTFAYSGAKQPSTVPTLLAVNVVRQGGTWKIDNIDTFNGTS
jgi:Mce-associated membrane protein